MRWRTLVLVVAAACGGDGTTGPADQREALVGTWSYDATIMGTEGEGQIGTYRGQFLITVGQAGEATGDFVITRYHMDGSPFQTRAGPVRGIEAFSNSVGFIFDDRGSPHFHNGTRSGNRITGDWTIDPHGHSDWALHGTFQAQRQ